MPRIKLTKSSIDALPTPSSDVVYWDAAYPGFGVKITPKGRKVFIVLYRTGGAGSYLRLSKNRSVVEISRLLRREVGKPWAGRSIHEYLAPLFGFLGDELTEAGGRARKHRDPQSVEPRFYSGIGETGIDLLVELINDFGGCVLWRADAEPDTQLVARHKLAHSRDIRKHFRAGRRCHRQRMLGELASPTCSKVGHHWDRCGAHFVEPIDKGE